ncbi:hypothetical protein [Borreliella garinii]|uniref:hypothetical protein n=1 Tax=Borreliella garinii TaxID=29519 RepID=UPI00040AF9B0
MKKCTSIFNIFFFISFFYSCLPAPESSKGVKTEILGFELIKEDNKKNIEEYNKKTLKKIITIFVLLTKHLD